MLVITTEEWIWFAATGISLCSGSFFLGGGLGFLAGVRRYEKEKKTMPVYPLKGMFKHFSAIEDKIKSSKNDKDLEDARLDLFAFAETYTDSGSFVSELQELYDNKENEVSVKQFTKKLIKSL